MISKLFKYDFRAIGTRLFPLYIAAIVVAIFNRFTFVEKIMYNQAYLDIYSDVPNIVQTLLSLAYGVGWLIIFAIFIVTFFVLVGHYSKSIFGDEGYLTNTLPITPEKIIFSKLLTYVVWNFIGFVVAVIAITITHFNTDFIREFIVGFKEFWAEILPYMTVTRWLIFALFVVTMIISQVTGVFTIFLSTAMGHQFKHKLAMGVCSYLGISFAASFVMNIVNTFTLAPFMDPSSALFLPEAAVLGEVMSQKFDLSILTVILGMFITTSFFAVVFFYSIKYFQTKKLNLE